MNTSAGFPVKYIWFKAIKKGNLETWPGLIYTNEAKYCPHSLETIKGHMVQSSQEVRHTKKTKHQARDKKKDPNQGTQEKHSEEEDIPPPHKTK